MSTLLIWCLGTRLYLKIPQRCRRRLGLVCGEDFSDINALLKRLQEAASDTHARP